VSSAVGTTIQGSLEFGADVDCFAFQIPQGVEELVEVQSDLGFAVFFIVAPDGTAGPLFTEPATISAGGGGRYVVCAQGTLANDAPLLAVSYTLRVHP
jgi:hypothetical protein